MVCPGFFLPLEQEVGRAVSDRRARDVGGGPVVRKAALAGGLLAVGLVLLALVGAAFLPFVDRMFHGQQALLACFAVALLTYAFQHITRGTLAGNGRFGPYGLILAAEGILRVAPLIVLWILGVDDLVWYGLALALPPLFASLIALRGQHGLAEPGPPAEWSELSSNLSLLFFGSLAAQTLSYSAALGGIVLAQNAAERDAVADFIVGFFIARIPILLFQAVQAALLPKLAALAGTGQHDDFRAGLRKLILIVIGIGAAGTIVLSTIGPTAGEILFGDKFNLDSQDLFLLSAGSALFILALTLAQALIALRGFAQALLAWCIGLAVCVVVTALSSDDLFLRVELGFVTGCAASAAAMALLLRSRMRSVAPGSLQLLVEQIEHEPLEI